MDLRNTFILSAFIFAAIQCGTDPTAAGPEHAQATGSSTDETASGGVGGGLASGGSASQSSTTTGSAGGAEATGVGGEGGGSGGAESTGTETGPLSGYGVLSGACGDITAADLTSDSPLLIVNDIDFSSRPPFDVAMLSDGGQAMYEDGNLGGSSLYSEIFAYEVLYRCEQAEFLKGEGGIVYATEGKKTDLLVAIDGEKIGVSVVRALSYPEGSEYPVSHAYDVLEGKLADILKSTANVAPEDAWNKQILSVIAQTPAHAAAIEEAYAMVDSQTKADTIVVITVSDGEDGFLYYNQ